MAEETGAETEVVRLWDPVVRVFHWVLAAAVFGSILTGLFGPTIMTNHFRLGLLIGILVVLRIVWGFVGPETARFRHFLRGPVPVVRYAMTLPKRAPSLWRGHSPTGGWATVVLLGLLLAQVLTGMMGDPEDFINRGPLAPVVGIDAARSAYAWHAFLSKLVMAMVVLHIAVIVFYARWKGENLVLPMILGRKRVRRGR
jgi:cytochrome b